MEEVYEAGKGEECKTGAETIDAVDKVDGVGNEYNDKDSQDCADGKWQLVDTKDTVEISYPKTRSGHEYGSYSLYEEFDIRGEANDVINESYDIHKKESDKENE